MATAKRIHITTREGIILAILYRRCATPVSGVNIQSSYAKVTGAKMPTGSLYNTLNCLKAERCIVSRRVRSASDNRSERGPGSANYYCITTKGIKQLEALRLLLGDVEVW